VFESVSATDYSDPAPKESTQSSNKFQFTDRKPACVS
jgi:hypothetical protein